MTRFSYLYLSLAVSEFLVTCRCYLNDEDNDDSEFPSMVISLDVLLLNCEGLKLVLKVIVKFLLVKVLRKSNSIFVEIRFPSIEKNVIIFSLISFLTKQLKT